MMAEGLAEEAAAVGDIEAARVQRDKIGKIDKISTETGRDQLHIPGHENFQTNGSMTCLMMTLEVTEFRGKTLVR